MDSSKQRTLGLTLVIVTGILCACPGILIAAFGAMMGFFGMDPATRMEYYQTNDIMPALFACLFGACVGSFLIAIPILIGFVTLRPDPASRIQPDEPLPPAI